MSVIEKNFFGSFGACIDLGGNTNPLDLDPQWLRSELATHRALVLRGLHLDLTGFRELSDLFSSKFLVHHARSLRPSINADATMTGVIAGNQGIHLHGEMYYFPVRPDAIFLFCSVPPQKDGETTLCDAIKLLSELSSKTQDMFRRRKIKFAHRMTVEAMLDVYGWSGLNQVKTELGKIGITNVRLDQEAGVYYFDFVCAGILRGQTGEEAFINSVLNMKNTVAKVNRTIVTWEDGSDFSPEIVQEINDAGENITQRHKWQANDVLIVDNTSVMHGRRPFTGERVVATRFASGIFKMAKAA